MKNSSNQTFEWSPNNIFRNYLDNPTVTKYATTAMDVIEIVIYIVGVSSVVLVYSVSTVITLVLFIRYVKIRSQSRKFEKNCRKNQDQEMETTSNCVSSVESNDLDVNDDFDIIDDSDEIKDCSDDSYSNITDEESINERSESESYSDSDSDSDYKSYTPKYKKPKTMEICRCINNHPLLFQNCKYSDWACAFCGEDGHGKRYQCSKCNFDLCVLCKRKKVECPKGHILEYGKVGFKYFCSVCGDYYRDKRFQCVKCKYNICNNCETNAMLCTFKVGAIYEDCMHNSFPGEFIHKKGGNCPKCNVEIKSVQIVHI